MPIYEYVCDECGCVESQLRAMTDHSAPVGCPNCTATMRRLFTPPAVMNRSKPMSTARALEARLKQADGRAGVFHALRTAEQRGGDEWRKVKSETQSSELRAMRRYKQETGL